MRHDRLTATEDVHREAAEIPGLPGALLDALRPAQRASGQVETELDAMSDDGSDILLVDLPDPLHEATGSGRSVDRRVQTAEEGVLPAQVSVGVRVGLGVGMVASGVQARLASCST